MIWATISSRPCFCWLYRTSSFLAAKNVINLISVLAIWWCPHLQSSLVLFEEGVCYDQCILLANKQTNKKKNSVSVCSASFYIPRQNLPVIPGISWLPTFAYQSPMMKMTSFFGIISRRFGKSSWNHSTSTSSALMVGA